MVISVSMDELVFLWFHKVPAADYSVEFSDFDSNAAVTQAVSLGFRDWKYPSISD